MQEQNEYTGQTMSFWKLISERHIRIPEIQRDYVQGRDDEQASQARTEILNDIQAHLESHTPMSLNFIYGEVEQDDLDERRCYPLDGQQRLTMLYLLHWLSLVAYLASLDIGARKQIDLIEYSRTLGNFSYRTRPTSSDFFKTLSEAKTLNDTAEYIASAGSRPTENRSCLSEYIKDKSWFRPDFLTDPTILSVLVVLDAMYSTDDFHPGEYWNLLIGEECPITFEWLDVENIGNGDDLYIKMNARGKQLSDFENLKAELENAAQNMLSAQESEELCNKFDQRWLDYFWRFGDGDLSYDPERCDAEFMNVLNWYLWNQWAIKASPRVPVEYSGDGKNLTDTRYRSLKSYSMQLADGENVWDEEAICRLTLLMDTVTNDELHKYEYVRDIDKIVKAVSTPGQVDYAARMDLESAVAYLWGMENAGAQPSDESWAKWQRIIRHLSDAATIWQGYNTLGQYTRAVTAVEEFAKKGVTDLTSYFAEYPEVTGFTPTDQTEEEKLKAALIIGASQIWRGRILDAESIGYFEGKIGFLLQFAGIEKENAADMLQDELAVRKFDNYLMLVKVFFEDQDDLLVDLRVALLTKGDFSGKVKSIRSYAIQKGRNDRAISWRNLLRPSTMSKLPEVMPELFDDILNRLDGEVANNSNVRRILRDIVSEYQWDESREDMQAKILIEHPELWRQGYFGKAWQYAYVDGICYLPQGSNGYSTVLSGLNYELVTCLIHSELNNSESGLRLTLRQIKGRLHTWEGPALDLLTVEKNGRTVEVGRGYMELGDGQHPQIILSEEVADADDGQEGKVVEADGKLSRVLATFAADNIDDAIREIRHLIS